MARNTTSLPKMALFKISAPNNDQSIYKIERYSYQFPIWALSTYRKHVSKTPYHALFHVFYCMPPLMLLQ